MESKTILKVRELKKSFSMHSEQTLVLKGIDADIYQKDFTIIMGSSGSGKSTFLYCVSGMDNVTDGQVEFQEKSIISLNENKLALLRRRNMGFVFQQMNLLPTLTLYENITVPAYLLHAEKTKEINQRADIFMRNFGIEALKNRTPNQVSGGQLQRAAIARALINNPDIIFADEPTGALNSSSSEDVLNILTDCNNSGQTILMVTHDVKAALRASRIIYIRDGMITGDKMLKSYSQDTDLKRRKSEVMSWLTEMGW